MQKFVEEWLDGTGEGVTNKGDTKRDEGDMEGNEADKKDDNEFDKEKNIVLNVYLCTSIIINIIHNSV